MNSAEVKKKQEPRVYLDATNFYIGVGGISEGLMPCRKPSEYVAKRLHLKSYTFDGVGRKLYCSPRAKCSGSTNGARLFITELGKKYESSNRKEKNSGVRNQLSMEDKAKIESHLTCDQQPTHYQLQLLYSLMDHMEEDMMYSSGGLGYVLNRKIFKLEFYIEINNNGNTDTLHDRIKNAVSILLGSPKEIASPTKGHNGERVKWTGKAKLNGKDINFEFKAYEKGRFTRLELVYNSPGITDLDTSDRSVFKNQIQKLSDMAVKHLTDLHQKIGCFESKRNPQDIDVLTSFCIRQFNSNKIDEVIKHMRIQYAEEGHFHVRNQAQNSQYKHVLAALGELGILKKAYPSTLTDTGKEIKRKRGGIYCLENNFIERINMAKKSKKAEQRKKRAIKNSEKKGKVKLSSLTFDPEVLLAKANMRKHQIAQRFKEILYDVSGSTVEQYLSATIKVTEAPIMLAKK